MNCCSEDTSLCNHFLPNERHVQWKLKTVINWNQNLSRGCYEQMPCDAGKSKAPTDISITLQMRKSVKVATVCVCVCVCVCREKVFM